MKKTHRLMILSLILATFYLITDLAQPKVEADSFISLNKSDVESKEGLEQDLTQSYKVQYKKRVDYSKSPTSSEALDYKDNILEEIITPKQENVQEPQIPPQDLQDSRPKIVIIIDDVENIRQLDEIKEVDLKLTPSIFPNENKEMINATNKLDFFMVHLPLEAKIYRDELDTIKTSDSIDTMREKIQTIKTSMPNVKYINNHTGSKFTANKESMESLLSVLDSSKITFVDSRTTPDTKLNEIAKEQNRLILYRDIFIDNSLDKNALNRQIKEGVKIAKKRGYAILIAHPHKETLRALKIAKDGALKDVDVVYLDELDRILQNAKITQYAQKFYK